MRKIAEGIVGMRGVTKGIKTYLVVWERMANSGMAIINADTPEKAIDTLGFSEKHVRMTAVEVDRNVEPVIVGKRG